MKTEVKIFATLVVAAAICQMALACSPPVYLKCQSTRDDRVACVQSKSGKCSPSSTWEATTDTTKYDTLAKCKENLCSRAGTCSNHGDCTPAGTCTCDANYFTSNCGVNCERNSTCSGNGDCTTEGLCNCDASFSGSDCSESLCSRADTCSDNGDCTPDGECDCDDNYYGAECDIFCSSNVTCNGYGVCDSNGECLCSAFDPPNCQPPQGTLRLTGHSRNDSGILEIYINGAWGTVCDDSGGNGAPISPDVGRRTAEVACRQLGFDTTDVGFYCCSNSAFTRSPNYNSMPTWLDEVVCTGSETELISCSRNALGVENCGHGEDVGITCNLSAFDGI